MRKWSWILTGLIFVVVLGALSYIYRNHGSVSIEDIEKRENVQEMATRGSYTLFIEKTKGEETQIKIHDMDRNAEIEIKGLKGKFNNIQWSPDGKYFIVDEINEKDDDLKITYILSQEELDEIEDVEDIDKICTIGDIIWSPDSNKLLIGVKNSEGLLDLAVYYIDSKSVETILEAEESVDYWPRYWDKDNNIGYAEDNTREKSIQYEISNSEEIMSIIKTENNTEDLSKVIELLLDVDFSRMEKIYGEESILELLEWLAQQEIKEKEEVLILLSLTDEFLGEENYKYIETLGRSYFKDKINFIKALAEVPDKIEEIAYSFHSISLYSEKDEDPNEDLKMFLASEKLDKDEKNVAIKFLNTYNACGT